MYKILINNFPYVSDSLDAFIKSAKMLGKNEIEFYGCSPHLYLYDCDIDRIKGIKQKLDDAKLKVVVFTPEQWDYQMSLALDEPKVRERSLDYYKRAIEAANILGAQYVSLIAGYGYLNGDRTDDYKRFVDGINILLEVAEKNNVTLLLENDIESCVNCTKELLKVMTDINNDRLKLLMNVNELGRCEGNIIGAYIKLKNYIRFIHISDSDSDNKKLIPGDGQLNLKPFINAVKDDNYDGYIAADLRGYKYMGNPEEATAKSLQFLMEE